MFRNDFIKRLNYKLIAVSDILSKLMSLIYVAESISNLLTYTHTNTQPNSGVVKYMSKC